MQHFRARILTLVTLLLFASSAKSETWQRVGFAVGRSVGNETSEGSYIMSNIHREGSTMVMYYTVEAPTQSSIKRATSLDGLTWNVSDTVLQGSATTSDQDFVIGGASAVKISNNRLRVYFRAAPQHSGAAAPLYQIFSAVSSDGISFTRESGTRIANDTYDSSAKFSLAGHGSFFKAATRYSGLFSANLSGQSSIPSDIYSTRSKDGLRWGSFKKLYEGSHDPTVLKVNGKYLVYASHLNSGFKKGKSNDGIKWPKRLTDIKLIDQDGSTLSEETAGVADLGIGLSPDGTLRLYSNYGRPSQNIAIYEKVRAS